MDKLKKIIKYDKRIMTFLNVIAIIGIITGSIFMVVLNKNDKEMVLKSIKDFFENLMNNEFNYMSTLKNTIISNLLFSLIIWIMGISVVGVLVVIFIVFYKSFTLGFTIASIIYTYSIKGCLIALLYIFPHMVINILILLYLSTYSIKLSIILIKSILRKDSFNFKSFINNYLKIYLITLIVLIISSLYESFISPILLRYFANLLIWNKLWYNTARLAVNLWKIIIEKRLL